MFSRNMTECWSRMSKEDSGERQEIRAPAIKDCSVGYYLGGYFLVRW